MRSTTAEPAVGRRATGPAVRRRRQELGQQIAVRGVQLDDLEARRGRVDRRAAEPLDDRVELAAAQRARTRRLARRAHRRRGHGGEPLLGAGRLAAEVHELARRDRALGPDRLRASGHARHGLGPPRLGGDPPPPRRLRATTVPPTVSIAAPPAARRRQYSASSGSGSPSSRIPRPCAVPTSRLRSVRWASWNGSAARIGSSALWPATADQREIAGGVRLVLGPQDLEHDPADPPAAGLAP